MSVISPPFPDSLEKCTVFPSAEEGIAGTPLFDRSNPGHLAYHPIKQGTYGGKVVFLDVTKTPFVVEKELDLPQTETAFINTWLVDFHDNILLYEENFGVSNGSDGKICYYRLDTGKHYCMKPVDGQEYYYHGYASFDSTHLLWKNMGRMGYVLRDMACYCKEEGVCPFE